MTELETLLTQRLTLLIEQHKQQLTRLHEQQEQQMTQQQQLADALEELSIRVGQLTQLIES